jgi:hypothetical protein
MKDRPRLKQAWTIAQIELRRAFFSKRAFWVYALALFPSLIFLGNSIHLKYKRAGLSSGGLTPPALIDSVREGESPEAVLQRLGKSPSDFEWQNHRRIRNEGKGLGITTHGIEPAREARYVRMNIFMPAQRNDPSARIYEFEVYGEGPANLALNRPATGSTPCSVDEGPEKAFNGSVKGGTKDRWCSRVPGCSRSSRVWTIKYLRLL